MITYILSSFLGFSIGLIYFYIFEYPDVNKISDNCFYQLHYLNKNNIISVHIKTIIAGLLLLYIGRYQCKYSYIVSFIGSAMISIHLIEVYIELSIA